MIYVVLSNPKTFKDADNVIREKIVEFVKVNIKFNNLLYRFILADKHLTDASVVHINNGKDIILWEPIVAYNNLELVKSYQNSLVILDRPSVYIQKISKHNPINENMAINHSFYLIYMNPDDVDITNKEWKLVVKKDMYLMSVERLIQFASEDPENIRKDKIKVPDVFDSIVNITKDQINLSINSKNPE